MHEVHRSRSKPRVPWLALVMLASCGFDTFSLAQTGSETSPPRPASPAGEHRVLVLSPRLTVESLSDGSTLPASQHDGPFIVSYLSGAALRELGDRKYSAVGSTDAAAAAVSIPSDTLSRGSSKLIRGIPSDEFKEALRAIAAEGQYDAVFAQDAQLKIGPGGSWNAWSGAITSDMSSLVLRAALINCATGENLWKAQSVHRGHERASEKVLRKLVQELYEGLQEAR